MLEDLYRDLVLDHFRNPRGTDPVPGADRRAEGQNPLCGDECSVALALDGDRLEGIEYHGKGCSISVASGSMMAEEVRGKTLAEVRALGDAFKAMLRGRGRNGSVDVGDLEALEGVSRFPVRVKCALLPWSTLEEALASGPGERKRVTTDTGAGGSP